MTKPRKYRNTKVWMCNGGHGYWPSDRGYGCQVCGEKLSQFDSIKEARRYQELRLLERAGKISDLKRQVKFPLMACDPRQRDPSRPIKIRSRGFPNGRQATWTADFTYTEDGKQVIEDVKGAVGKASDTTASRLKRAIVEAMLDTEIKVT